MENLSKHKSDVSKDEKDSEDASLSFSESPVSRGDASSNEAEEDKKQLVRYEGAFDSVIDYFGNRSDSVKLEDILDKINRD